MYVIFQCFFKYTDTFLDCKETSTYCVIGESSLDRSGNKRNGWNKLASEVL